MTIRIYNTMTGKKEDVVPLQEKKVGSMSAGHSLRSLPHRPCPSTIVFDTIYRYLGTADMT